MSEEFPDRKIFLRIGDGQSLFSKEIIPSTVLAD
jgi:hypothetical protein